MFLYMAADLIQLGLVETEIRSKRNRLKPKRRFEVVAGDVDVRRLADFTAVEMKPVGAHPENRGHEKQ
jgi:hypothetical protein